MVKDDPILATGVVEEGFPNAFFRVRITDGSFPEDHKVLARTGGKLKKYFIKILPGDEVTVEVSPYDLKRGRIIYREK